MEDFPIKREILILSSEEDGVKHFLYVAIIWTVCKLERSHISKEVFKLYWKTHPYLTEGHVLFHLSDYLIFLCLAKRR